MDGPPPPPPLDDARLGQLRARLARIGMASALGMRILQLRPGEAVLELPFDPRVEGAFGSYHGGAVAALADTCAAFALRTMLPDSVRFATTNLDIQYLRRTAAPLRAHGVVRKVGARQSLVAVEVREAAGELVALCSVSFLDVPWARTDQISEDGTEPPS